MSSKVFVTITSFVFTNPEFQFGSVAFKISSKGLEPKYWLVSLAIIAPMFYLGKE